MILLNFILVIALVAFAFYSPNIFYGTSFKEVIEILQDPDYKNADAITKFTKSLNLTNQTLDQFITKVIATAIGIVVVGIVLIVLFNAIVKKLNRN